MWVQTQPKPPQRCSPAPLRAVVGEDLCGAARNRWCSLSQQPLGAAGWTSWGSRDGDSMGWPLGSMVAMLGVKASPACLLPALCLHPALPPSQPVQKSLLCCWAFFPPFNS